jgi:subtilase family serine protease
MSFWLDVIRVAKIQKNPRPFVIPYKFSIVGSSFEDIQFHCFMKWFTRTFLLLLCLSSALYCQIRRITAPIDENVRASLPGHLHPSMAAERDEGRVEAVRRLDYVTLFLTPSASQQEDLDHFLKGLQDSSSPDYHRWLTPEQYAARFGLAEADIDQIRSWLTSRNLKVLRLARGHNAISISGSVRSFETAFRTEIHRYRVNGERHFANSSDPSIPSALRGVVETIHGLNDFPLKASPHIIQGWRASKALPMDTRANHFLEPRDLATIYDIQRLYDHGISGAGQTIAIIGGSQIDVSDIRQYRSTFGLPLSDPRITLVPNTKDPGISQSSLIEADLDIELAGAVAPDATILFVYSSDAFDAIQYAIDQNLAPVLSTSFRSM